MAENCFSYWGYHLPPPPPLMISLITLLSPVHTGYVNTALITPFTHTRICILWITRRDFRPCEGEC